MKTAIFFSLFLLFLLPSHLNARTAANNRTAASNRIGLTITDTFTRPVNTNLGVNWVQKESQVGTFEIETNGQALIGSTAGHQDSWGLAFFNVVASDNQAVQISIISRPGFQQPGLGQAVRIDPNSTLTSASFYMLNLNVVSLQAELTLFENEDLTLSGEGTFLGAANVSINNGDTFKLEAIGSTFNIYKNGVLTSFGTFTDTTLSSGRAGLVSFHDAAQPSPSEVNMIIGDWILTRERLPATNRVTASC